jgi:hypothetical protein
MLRPLLLALLLPMPGIAETLGQVPPDDVARLEILPGWREGGVHVAALRITLAPGWKTYWRSPGEGGLPPVFSWKGSENLGDVRFQWPVPEVFLTNGMRSIGYHDSLVLPVLATTQRPDQPVHLRGELEIGVCDTVCLPWSARFDALLPPNGAPDPEIRAALADRPRTASEAGAGIARCSAEPIQDGLRLTAILDLPRQGRDEVVVVETGTAGIWVSEATSERRAGQLVASADLVPPDARPFPIDRSALRFTVLGDDRAVDIQGCQGG